MPYHTHLREVFRALGDCETRVRWLLSGMWAIGNPTLPGERLDEAPDVWVSGERLQEIVEGFRFQLVWGSLSGFPPDHELNESEELANAPSPLQFRGAIQYPNAEIEIVAFDSSFTAVVARDSELEQAFKAHFAEARDWIQDA
jgi:hypothetical protein